MCLFSFIVSYRLFWSWQHRQYYGPKQMNMKTERKKKKDESNALPLWNENENENENGYETRCVFIWNS